MSEEDVEDWSLIIPRLVLDGRIQPSEIGKLTLIQLDALDSGLSSGNYGKADEAAAMAAFFGGQT